MSSDPVKFLVLPYLQLWDAEAKALSLRVLIIPRDSFIEPFVSSNPTSPAFFPNAQLKFDIRVLSGFQNLPTPGSGISISSISFAPDPSYAAVFKSLKDTFGNDINIHDPPRARESRDPEDLKPKSVRKHLPASYRDATGYSPNGDRMFTTDNTYSCAMKKVRPKAYKRINPRPFLPSWGELIASILRIPDFAIVAGFIRICDVKVTPEVLEEGGYIWFELDPQTAVAIGVSDAAPMKTYATRIPPLTVSRDLFTPVLFPVLPSPPTFSFDIVFQEAEDYVDGWAKAVHCFQPEHMNIVSERGDNSRPSKDLGIRIGWDDEQVTVWADRQINPDPRPEVRGFDDFPLGVHGYRVDVRDITSPTWYSLARAEGNFGIKAINFGQIKLELGVEVHPVTPTDVVEDRSYWLPMYFTNWAQASLVGIDDLAMTLLGRPTATSGTQHRGVIDPALQMRYGKTYQFRVRLMDHTGGGPGLKSISPSLGPSPSPKIPFRRWIRPMAPILVGRMPSLKDKPGAENEPTVTFIELERPPMSYPAVMFAGYPDAMNELKAIAATIPHEPTDKTATYTEPSLPDPDVDRMEITVLVQTVTQDPLAEDGPYMKVYTTTRFLPSDLKGSVKVDLAWQDCPDVWNPPSPWNSTSTEGPLMLPKARVIRLRINALCRDEPDLEDRYFGADDVRRGPQLMIPLRKNSDSEADLFVKNTDSYTINGIFLQPSPDTIARLATAIGLRSKDNTTLRSQSGKRIVFACSSSLLHLIGPDRASLSFTSYSDLALQWIVVIRLTLQRDWSWDGFPIDGIIVLREGQKIPFAPNHNVNEDALYGATPERSSSDIVIIDIVDPKPLPGEKLKVLSLEYEITTKFLAKVAPASESPMKLKIDLPLTTPPAQIPDLASAGIAMSSYIHDVGYSTTLPRTKMLWLEFASPLEDPEDRYFGRVLKYAPDPLLLGEQYHFQDSVEPPMSLDPEYIRHIVPGQSTDFAGLDAMQPLVPTSSPLHWGLPLPPGLTEASLELFGFWTYEFRVGHFNDKTHTRWCTAQGRFGAPFRVSGIQHPPPLLVCSMNRDSKTISVSAPIAKPVRDGNILYIKLPSTQIWFLLYAQASQIDGGGEKRNILIARTRGSLGEGGRPESVASFSRDDIGAILDMYGLKRNTPLSVLAVEMFNQIDHVSDPLGGDLGRQSILRSGCLVAVPSMC
ncbi:hypothetical protein BGZ60DRAFT_535650 [Tricladium varicosporioides]|nr:hypothetical protein BGZ60DRAFT_535650 [Hymenoscyphus varicosporioides]